MDNLNLLVDLHTDTMRQGPGGEEETIMAIALSGLPASGGLKIADIGCGSGASSLVLARNLDADIVAVDLVPAFLAALRAGAARAGLADRIFPVVASMDALPFGDGEFDAIWSEGAIYNIGFAAGIRAWRRLLKPGGILAVSELTWLTKDRPAELEAYWRAEYAEVDTASAKMAVLEELGFAPVGYFALPERCWLDNYYRPIEQRFAGFLHAHADSDAARAVVSAQKCEIALYERYKALFGYGYYIARNIAA